MAAGMIMAQVDNANQASQLLAMSGKSFTVGKISAAGNGLQNMLTLTPTGNAGGAVAIKLEGTRQMMDLAALSGKTVTVAKPAMMAGGAGNWLAIKPVAAGATAKATAGSATLVKLEGARQSMQAAGLTGQQFTVVKPVMAGGAGNSTLFLQPAGGGDIVALKMANAAPMSGMVGKSVVVGKAPLVAGGKTGTAWLSLKPVAAATTAKTVAGGTVVAGAATATPANAIQMKTVAMTKVAVASPKAAAAGAIVAKGGATGGTIWKGTGLGLGVGLGLGIWGPIIVAGVGAAAVYGYVKSRKTAET